VKHLKHTNISESQLYKFSMLTQHSFKGYLYDLISMQSLKPFGSGDNTLLTLYTPDQCSWNQDQYKLV